MRELAAYERAADAVELDAHGLRRALFGPDPKVFAHVAEHRGRVEGCAVWFVTFSTWTGVHGVWLEDLFVRPDCRGLGLGRALMAAVATVAVRAGYRRLDWSVLNWNAPAQGFYRQLGAAPMDTWTQWRVEGAALRRLAAANTP